MYILKSGKAVIGLQYSGEKETNSEFSCYSKFENELAEVGKQAFYCLISQVTAITYTL